MHMLSWITYTILSSTYKELTVNTYDIVYTTLLVYVIRNVMLYHVSLIRTNPEHEVWLHSIDKSCMEGRELCWMTRRTN